jgi:hypothetical protein
MGEDPMKAQREWYDSTDLDYSKLRRVQLRRAGGAAPLSTFAVRLEGEVIDELRRVAAEQEVGATQLVREWILERLAKGADGGRTLYGQQARQAFGLSEADLVAALRPLVHEMVAEELVSTGVRRVASAKRAPAKRVAATARTPAKRVPANKAPARRSGPSTAG